MCSAARLCVRLAISMTATLLAGCITSPPYIEGDAGAFFPKLGGNVQLDSSSGSSGARLDVKDFGLDDRDTNFAAAVRGGGLGINGSISGFRMSVDGDGTLPGPFGDIPGGSNVSSSFDLDDVKATATLTLLDVGPFRFAAGLGVEYFNAEFKAESNVGGEQKIEAEAPVPLGVVEGQLTFGPFRALASFAGMTGSWGDSDGTFLDGELSARFAVFEYLELFASYRYIQINAEASTGGQDFEMNVDLSGPTVGLALRF
jgi:hypothetical protein